MMVRAEEVEVEGVETEVEVEVRMIDLTFVPLFLVI